MSGNQLIVISLDPFHISYLAGLPNSLIGDQLMATNLTSEALPTGNASKKRKLAEVIK